MLREKKNRLSFPDFLCKLFAANTAHKVKRDEETEKPLLLDTQKTRGAQNHDVPSRRQLITTERETTLGHKGKQLINLSSVFFCIQAVNTHLVLLSCLISHLSIHKINKKLEVCSNVIMKSLPNQTFFNFLCTL